MKFIDDNGQLRTGTPLTQIQVEQREQIRVYAHQAICSGAYHGAYDRSVGNMKCERLANFFVQNFILTPINGDSIEVTLRSATQMLEPISEPEVAPEPPSVRASEPEVSVTVPGDAKDDDIPW